MSDDQSPGRAIACPSAETLAAYVNGRIGEHELAEISNHLVDCERCYENIAATVRVLSGVGRAENIAPPWALLPALLTGTVMAIALTVSLLLLLRGGS